jgi:multiple sugar transport system permease protein
MLLPISYMQEWTSKGVVAFIQFWMWYGNSMIVLIAGVAGHQSTCLRPCRGDGANPTRFSSKSLFRD